MVESMNARFPARSSTATLTFTLSRPESSASITTNVANHSRPSFASWYSRRSSEIPDTANVGDRIARIVVTITVTVSLSLARAVSTRLLLTIVKLLISLSVALSAFVDFAFETHR